MNKGLTSFRAFAFLAVFLYHCKLLEAGYLGVQAFFVLSGFLLTPILVDMKASLGRREYFTHFYGRRSLRIFPLYYVYLALATGFVVWVWWRTGFAPVPAVMGYFKELPWALTYTYNFFFAAHSHEASQLVSHFWSLAVEEQFYLVWPLVLILTPKRRLGVVLSLLVLAGPLLRYAVTQVWASAELPGIQGPVHVAVYALPFAHFDAFAIGGLFALFQKSRRWVWSWVLIAAVVGLGYATEYASRGAIHNWTGLGYQPLMLDSHKAIWGYSVLNLTFAFLLVQIRDGLFLRLVFENRIVRYLGEISYGLYVFHFATLGYFLVQYPAMSPNVQHVLALLTTVAISALSYELMEKRFIRLKDRYFARR
jgi:peptidoglycan/LPS O-acetylase OafA/YrhL